MARGLRWTKQETDLILAHASTLKAREIAELLPGRNKASVRDYLRKHDVKGFTPGGYIKRVWTAEEEAFLRANYAVLSMAKLAEGLGCKRGRIVTKMRCLQLKGRSLTEYFAASGKQWTAELVEALKRDVPYNMTTRQFAKLHHIAEYRAHAKVRELGLPTSKTLIAWTDADDAKLKELAASQTHTARQIAAQMGRTIKAVSNRAYRLGVHILRQPAAERPARQPRASRSKHVVPIKRIAAGDVTRVRAVYTCPTYHCPVSNRDQHRERLGCNCLPPYLQEWNERRKAA
jgi:hypothetical protein